MLLWILAEIFGGIFLKAYKDTYGVDFDAPRESKEKPENLPRLPAPIDNENGSA